MARMHRSRSTRAEPNASYVLQRMQPGDTRGSLPRWSLRQRWGPGERGSGGAGGRSGDRQRGWSRAGGLMRARPSFRGIRHLPARAKGPT